RVEGRTAADLGASAGGFTTALLERGARRVYAIDAGVGQLLGRLRIDPRVVTLEGCNIGALTPSQVPEVVDVVTMDLSYLALADALPQLRALVLSPAADLVALVKPTFELRRARLAAGDADVAAAVRAVRTAARSCGWRPLGTVRAPRTGRAGAAECFLHARWVGP
ncbi:MAG TPA: SAM-dependent methyltransferase, partial [Acidimicrobiales bacterium]|nr:SAM-dependent methyltransferase [Acidimicrobiales bacterium]